MPADHNVMIVLSKLARGLAGAAALSLIAAPVLAQPAPDPSPDGSYDNGRYDNGQPSDQDAYRSYQDCQSAKTNHAVAGAVIGGVLGAVVGSQVSGRGARTEGSVLGGGGGAIAGAAIGSSSTHCETAPPPPVVYYPPPPPPPYYAPPPACDWVNSLVYMPDGTVQKRLVHVCEDQRGRWQVVD